MLHRTCKHNAKQNVNMVAYDERAQFLRAYECNLFLRVIIMQLLCAEQAFLMITASIYELAVLFVFFRFV